MTKTTILIIRFRTSLRKIIYTSMYVMLLAHSMLAKASEPQSHILVDHKNISYKIGVFPHLSKTSLQKSYQSIINSLTNNLSYKIYFTANESVKQFYQGLKDERYDIIIVQPFEYISLKEKYDYTPLTTQKQSLRSLIVAKKGRGIQTIQNLLGRKLLLPPKSTAISYLTKKHLHDFGFDLSRDITIEHERTHIACLQKLLLGFTDACATTQTALQFFEQRLEIKFQVITQTPEIPHALFVAHPRIDSAHRQEIINALLKWRPPAAQDNSYDNKWLTPLRKITDADYDTVRQIKTEVDAYPSTLN